MNDDFHLLWGLPILKTKINSNLYNKKDILEVIENNYKKRTIRQNWSTSYFNTNIHHSLSDDNNKDFDKPNYFYLKKVYFDIIKKYLNNMSFVKNFNFNYEIVNYTASRHESIMEPHLHIDCEFSMIHYLQFDKDKNCSTVFINPYTFNDFWPNKLKLSNKISGKITDQSWVHDEWKYEIEEDDCIVFPAILKHFVRNQNTKKTRVTIASNINVW